VIEDAVEEHDVERIEAELRHVVEVADLERHVVGRAVSVLGEESCLLDPLVPQIEAHRATRPGLLRPEQEGAGVAGAIEHAASLETVRIDASKGPEEVRALVDQRDERDAACHSVVGDERLAGLEAAVDRVHHAHLDAGGAGALGGVQVGGSPEPVRDVDVEVPGRKLEHPLAQQVRLWLSLGRVHEGPKPTHWTIGRSNL
jgi:hypothetical protein